MAAAGSNSPHCPREGELCHRRTNNFIDNASVRKIGNGGEKRKQKENSPSPPPTEKLQMGNSGGEIFIPSVERGLGGAETVWIKISLLLSCDGGTENERIASTRT